MPISPTPMSSKVRKLLRYSQRAGCTLEPHYFQGKPQGAEPFPSGAPVRGLHSRGQLCQAACWASDKLPETPTLERCPWVYPLPPRGGSREHSAPRALSQPCPPSSLLTMAAVLLRKQRVLLAVQVSASLVNPQDLLSHSLSR